MASLEVFLFHQHQNSPQSVEEQGGIGYVTCAALGGGYSISRELAEAELSTLTEKQKSKLSFWIYQQNLLGLKHPKIDAKVLSSIKSSPMPTITRRIESLILEIFRLSETPGKKVPPFSDSFFAAAACLQKDELIGLLEYAISDGLLEGKADDYNSVWLSLAGFKQAEHLRGKNIESQQGFISRWFSDEMEQAGAAMRLAIEDAGYSPVDLSVEQHIDHLSDKIISEIRRSRFVVADFTCPRSQDNQGLHRGGVYYEAGFARGANIPVIWTCRKDRLEDLHFDVQQFPMILWSQPEELREKLALRLSAVIGDGPRRGN
ncbi:MAG: hypothetical protein KTR21_02575 [Rhodobacteraceae bacterium]|nr:hypothetical protein [Paracoccaceae bacterium]